MNAKNKKLLAIVGVAAVLLIVIGVSVSMLGKGDQPSGTDPAAAPTDVTTEDVSQPPEEETTTPTVEVPPPLQTSPKTAIHRMAPSTLRASAGFPMKEAAPLGFQLGMMEMN